MGAGPGGGADMTPAGYLRGLHDLMGMTVTTNLPARDPDEEPVDVEEDAPYEVVT